MKISRSLLLSVGVAVLLISQSVSAQTKADAAEAFNQAAKLINEKKWDQALPLLEKAAKVSGQLGVETEELLLQSQKYLPLVRVEVGMSLARAGKFETAVPVLEQACEEAKSAFDATSERKAKQGLMGVYYKLAEQEQNANQPIKALAHYNKTVELNANIAPVYYNMGLCYQQLDSINVALAMYEKAIDIARKTNKPDVQSAARNASKNYLKTKGIKAKDLQDWKLAMEFFKKAQQVDDTDADSYLLLAICANKAQLWDETIAATTKGITVEKRSSERARLQFEEAIAWFSKGDVKKSCAILKLITDPAYKAQAAKQIAANKCDTAN